MKTNTLFNKENLFIVLLLLFSLSINQYYGNRGIFPTDSFSHFDTGFRILLGEQPFRDYWIVSGPFVDYIQAFIFYLLGVSWQTYVFHASIINAILTILTFLILKNFKLNIFYCFIYSLFFSILAYTSSGTPFVDHHSAFFSLIGIYILIMAIKNDKIHYWILLPFFFVLAFLSKQVPASYVIMVAIIILAYYSIVLKKFKWIQYSFFGSILSILALTIFGKIQGIHLASFLEQYIFYSQTIGEKRLDNISITFRGLVGHFKFIHLALLPLFYINVKKLYLEKDYFKKKDFIYFLILILFTFSLIFHQLITRNQTFIFFLIPILAAFSSISINSNRKIISYVIIFICLYATSKYHLRFNEGRKIHELNLQSFNLESVPDAKEIDKKLSGLNWITPRYKNNPKEEIVLINEIVNYLKKDKRNKMLLTNYSFFSAILEEKLFSTTRWHIFDGTDYPQKNTEYFSSYKKLLIGSIKDNKIDVIYMTSPLTDSYLFDYIDKNCFEKKKITKILNSYDLNSCKEINR